MFLAPILVSSTLIVLKAKTVRAKQYKEGGLWVSRGGKPWKGGFLFKSLSGCNPRDPLSWKNESRNRSVWIPQVCGHATHTHTHSAGLDAELNYTRLSCMFPVLKQGASACEIIMRRIMIPCGWIRIQSRGLLPFLHDLKKKRQQRKSMRKSNLCRW